MYYMRRVEEAFFSFLLNSYFPATRRENEATDGRDDY